MEDGIAVMNLGKIQQMGQLIDLYEKSINCFVAEFLGNCAPQKVNPM